MEKIKNCLVCSSEHFSTYLKCTDYLVTKEEFVLCQCNNCGFVFTNPRPASDEILPYYKSEDYYSHRTENKSFLEKIYNVAREINIKHKLNLIKDFKGAQGTLLDYGCGVGLFVKSANNAGWKACGLEPNSDARDVAISLGLEVDAPNKMRSLKNKSFDVITLWHVLEHLHDIEDVLPLLKTMLNTNGILVIAVPNLDSWDAKKYKENWAAYDAPRHLYHFSPDSIKNLFSKFGMRVVKTYPLKFDSFYISLLSEKKSWISYLHAFINGFRSNFNAKKTGDFSSMIYFIQ